MTETSYFAQRREVVAASQLTAFRQFCEAELGRSISGEEALYRFSVDEYQLFWRLFLAWSDILREGVDQPVCAGDSVELGRFFPNLHLITPRICCVLTWPKTRSAPP